MLVIQVTCPHSAQVQTIFYYKYNTYVGVLTIVCAYIIHTHISSVSLSDV